MDLQQCQIISDALVRIDAKVGRVDSRIRKAADLMRTQMMPYLAKCKADAWINEARTMLREIEDEKQAIFELLKQEREGQG